MKIAILCDDFPPKSFGGAGIVAFEQARELARRGHDVVVITTTQDVGDVGQIIFEGMAVHRLYANYHERFRAYRSLYNTQTIPEVKNLLRRLRPDIIHVHNIHYFLSYHVLALAHQYGKRVFLTTHDAMLVHYGKLFPHITTVVDGVPQFDYRISAWKQLLKYRFRFNPLRNFIIRQYLKNVDKIFAVSKATAEALLQNGIDGVPVLYNGVDGARFSVSSEKVGLFKKKYSLEDKKVMFFAGRISAAKGGDVALALLARVHAVLPNVCLLIAGKGDVYVQQLMQKAKNMKLEDSIFLTGWVSRDEISSAYTASDLILSLSLYLDPFPTVNLEAMAARKPVLGTCFGGTSEIVVDGQTGYIVDPNNVERASERALAVLGSEVLAERLGNAGYTRVQEQFSLSKQVDILEKYYSFN